jgi:hypothetical protein
MAMPEHTPEIGYNHTPGAIAGAKKGKKMTFEQADNGNCNPYYDKGFIGYKTNCQTCVAVYVARRQGYNVRALPNLNNKDIKDLSHMTNIAYVDKNGSPPIMRFKPQGTQTAKWLSNNMKDGEIYAVRGTWKGKHSGHIITAEKINGEIRFYDPQINKIYSATDAQIQIFGGMKNISAFNVTNVKLNEKFCDKIMKGNK